MYIYVYTHKETHRDVQLNHFAVHQINITLYINSCVCVLSHVSLQPHGPYVAHQAPRSLEFSRKKKWSRLPFSTLEDLPDPGMKPSSMSVLHLQADSVPLFHLESPFVNQLYLNTQFWLGLVIEARFDAVKSNMA